MFSTYIISSFTSDSYPVVISLIKENQLSELEKIATITCMGKVPKTHLDKLVEYKYTIYIDSEKLLDIINQKYDVLNVEINAEDIIGWHRVNNGVRTIIIDKNVENITKSIVHEIGHAIDSIYKITKEEEFIVLYNKENNRIRPYAQQSAREYFAEFYSIYYMTRIGDTSLYTRIVFPETTLYFENFMKEIENQ